MDFVYNTVEEALEELRAGKVILVTRIGKMRAI